MIAVRGNHLRRLLLCRLFDPFVRRLRLAPERDLLLHHEAVRIAPIINRVVLLPMEAREIAVRLFEQLQKLL